jgi:CelD/BcsL family acetyltransferase involved in cellulose biosynthesis
VIAGGALRVEIIPPDGFGQWRPAWERLWKTAPGATPFCAPAWLMPWARHHAPGRCWAAALCDADELAAWLPVFCWNKAMLLAGTGPSDYGEALFRPGSEPYVGTLLNALIDAVAGPFQRIELQQLMPGSPLLESSVPPGWRDGTDEGEPCPALMLNGPDGMGNVPRRQQDNWRYAVRRLEREGGAVELAPPHDVGRVGQELQRLHSLRWGRRGERGVLADPLLAGTINEALPELAASGLLRLHCLKLHSDTVGVLLAMRGRRQTFYYLGGFDPALARLSPGTILVGAAIAAAARESDMAFDFLRGREPYKYRWGALDRPTFRRVLERAP